MLIELDGLTYYEYLQQEYTKYLEEYRVKNRTEVGALKPWQYQNDLDFRERLRAYCKRQKELRKNKLN